MAYAPALSRHSPEATYWPISSSLSRRIVTCVISEASTRSVLPSGVGTSSATPVMTEWRVPEILASIR